MALRTRVASRPLAVTRVVVLLGNLISLKGILTQIAMFSHASPCGSVIVSKAINVHGRPVFWTLHPTKLGGGKLCAPSPFGVEKLTLARTKPQSSSERRVKFEFDSLRGNV